MAASLRALLDLLDLEALEVDLFRGPAPDTDRQRVFGGQVAGQALVAAGRTVADDRRVHSLHAYFLRPGDPTRSIVYQVDRTRDGRSVSTRRVVALQHGAAIFTMAASFHGDEQGLEHQDPAPVADDPDSLDPPEAARSREWSAIDLRFARRSPTAVDAQAHVAHQQVWLRASQPLPDDPLLHVCVLAYASDLTLLGTALVPHDGRLPESGVKMASLDHAMWFHRPFRADEWLLYDEVSPSASGARGLAAGRIFTRDGALVASVMQEGMIRLPR